MEAEEFKRLLLPLADKLFRISRSLVKNDDEAKDIVQDTFLKLWEIRDKLAAIDNYEAFCIRMVKNLSLDYLKSARVRNEDDKPGDEAAKNVSEESPEPDALNRMIENESGRIVGTLIDRLPDQQKEIIKLRHYSECSIEEIVSLTGMSAVNIRTILSRARKKIKEQFEKIFENELN